MVKSIVVSEDNEIMLIRFLVIRLVIVTKEKQVVGKENKKNISLVGAHSTTIHNIMSTT